MKFAFYTLGCKVNQYETQAMEQRLLEDGHTLGAFAEPCDGYIVNTCTVTAISDKKCRNAIRRARKLNPDAAVGVCGCYAQVSPEEIRALGVDVLAGTAKRMEFLRAVVKKAAERSGGRAELLGAALQNRTFEQLPAGGLAVRTRAMLKVQDGCCNFCAYCIIPYARGPVRSLPLARAVEQARRVADEGYRELVVTGIEISSWGADFQDGSSLLDLLPAVCGAVPGLRVRLGSLEPRTVTEDFCRTLRHCENLCPHFHLSLQSGADTVLTRMRRRYDTARYLQSVRLLNRYFPRCAVTTDLIVAFPGETEEEFRQSLDFLDACAFADVHVFPYSRRKGTLAAGMPGQHGNAVKAQRSALATAAAERLEARYRTAMIGSVQEVLFEQAEGECFTGHAKNYVRVFAKGRLLHNQVRSVRVTGLCPGGVTGELIDSQSDSEV